jgi:hypothetical protein
MEALPQRQTTAPDNNDREQATATDNDREVIDTQTHVEQSRVAVVDGMLELQALDKPTWIRNCSHLATHFYSRIDRKCQEYDEVHLVFDRYDVSRSLKSATRDTRQGENLPMAYCITDTTYLTKLTIKKLISHVKTKDEFSIYLAEQTVKYAAENNRPLVVDWRDSVRATHGDHSRLASNQEEPDT